MTDREAFESIARGGVTDFARAVTICDACGSYCLVGGLAVNCYVEPVYTMDADLVVSAPLLVSVEQRLRTEGFTIQDFPHSLNAQMPGSQLRIQFTKDVRYQDFVARAERKEIFGVVVCVAALADLVQGKIWAWSDPQRRLSKRQKDQADLVRIAETYPELHSVLPLELQRLFAPA